MPSCDIRSFERGHRECAVANNRPRSTKGSEDIFRRYSGHWTSTTPSRRQPCCFHRELQQNDQWGADHQLPRRSGWVGTKGGWSPQGRRLLCRLLCRIVRLHGDGRDYGCWVCTLLIQQYLNVYFFGKSRLKAYRKVWILRFPILSITQGNVRRCRTWRCWPKGVVNHKLLK